MLDFQRGSRDAFAELFHRYREAVYGFFRRRLNSAACAEELAQEVFLAVIRGLSRYEPRATFRAYLYGIAFNQLAAERRKKAEGNTNATEAAEATASHDPDSDLWVRQAVEKLDSDDREIVLLREYEQLSYGEIATLLRVPVNTVRSRLFRARRALKELLVPQRGSS